MRAYKSLSHTRWDCKYHVVFIPKRRKKLIYGPIRKHLGEIFHELDFWARGYFVSTIGLDEERVRAYVRDQEHEDAQYDQLDLLR